MMRWISDQKEREFCVREWKKAVENAKNNTDLEYMDMVFDKIEDADRFSERSKGWWKKTEFMVLLFSSAATFLNVLAATCIDMEKYINIIAAFITMLLSIVNGWRLIRAYKETWLRQSKFRSELVMECLRFAGKIGEGYMNATADEQISHFQEKIANIIRDDYDRFFQNMSKD